ncbi:MAG: septum formation protein Maf [Spirochaetia bacterium]|nr:septum formation protein Maf [Spirochaetia bacterium]
MFSDTILLASSSPRRQQLLAALGVPFVAVSADIDESACDHMPVYERVQELAKRKSLAGADAWRSAHGVADCPRWALGADTLVALDGTVFGKPADREHARTMLETLSGRTHEVLTGLAVLDTASGVTRMIASRTDVSVAAMGQDELTSYLDTGEWMGAAGAYRAQERAGLFIERVSGSFSGVVGLPLREFYVILGRSGYPLRR